MNLAGNTGDGLQLEWNKTNVTTLASSQTATIAGRIRIRNDGGETGIVFNVADGDAATDLLVSAGIGQSGGNMGITKNGDGLMALTGTNTYGGDTTVNQGTLWVSGRLTGNGALTLKDDTALTVMAGGATPAITTTGDMNVGSTPGSPTGTNTINIAGLTSTSVAPMSAGALYFDNPVTINILYVAPTVGQYPLIHASGGATIYGLTLGTLPYGISATLVDDTAGPTQSIYLDVQAWSFQATCGLEPPMATGISTPRKTGLRAAHLPIIGRNSPPLTTPRVLPTSSSTRRSIRPG